MDAYDALARCYDAARPVIAAITPDDLDKPTPCDQWPVRQVLSHYITVLEMFPVLLAGGAPDWGKDMLSGDPAADFDAAVERNLAAWREPGAVERDSMLPGMKMADLNLLDTIAHPWDIGSGIGLRPAFDEGAVQLCYDRWIAAPLDMSRQMGAFGADFPVPADAPVLDRLLGLSGRDPGWSAPPG